MMIIVDNMRLSTRVKAIDAEWSHLTCIPMDLKELLDFGRKIGLKVTWLQIGGSHIHFDVTESMRIRAIHNGAKEVSIKEYVELVQQEQQRQREEEELEEA